MQNEQAMITLRGRWQVEASTIFHVRRHFQIENYFTGPYRGGAPGALAPGAASQGRQNGVLTMFVLKKIQFCFVLSFGKSIVYNEDDSPAHLYKQICF